MVLISDVYVVTRPHVIADFDRKMADYAASLSDEATITDRHHSVGETGLTGHHSRRQRAVRSDHGVASDVHILLVEDRRPRETDDASFPERTETTTPSTVRTDRSPPS